MVIFRENTEDIYAGIEFQAGSPRRQKVLDVPQQEFPEQLQEGPLPGSTRDRLQARVAARAASG